MFASLIRSGLSRWMLAAIFVAASVPSATAVNAPPRRPTAPEILEAAVMKIEAATTKATDRIEVLADRAVYRLERSARAGASRASLEKAANKAKKGFSSPARSGYAQVTREVGTAMIRMRSAEEYTTDLQDDLFFAREVAGGTLEDAVQAARTRVDEALAAVPATP